jgi:hypothetical protein
MNTSFFLVRDEDTIKHPINQHPVRSRRAFIKSLRIRQKRGYLTQKGYSTMRKKTNKYLAAVKAASLA